MLSRGGVAEVLAPKKNFTGKFFGRSRGGQTALKTLFPFSSTLVEPANPNPCQNLIQPPALIFQPAGEYLRRNLYQVANIAGLKILGVKHEDSQNFFPVLVYNQIVL